MRPLATIVAASAFALAAGTSHAIIVASGGSSAVIAPPASTALGALESNTDAWAFNEVQSFTLTAPLAVDATTPGTYNSNASLTPGVIPAGTIVNSHYIYSDPVGGTESVYEGFVRFSQPIIGIIVFRAGLNGSDAILGASGTTYADNAARGLELSANADRFVITLSQFEVRYNFRTSGATDDIRVLTIPAPGAASLAAIGALAIFRRRR
jgi:hypothetical protein